MSAATTFVTLTPDDLDALVRKAIREVNAETLPEVLTREQTAAFLQCSLPTLMKHQSENGLPAHKLGDREWRFLRSEVLAWVAKRNAK